jgi:Holliday junction DNA helicase RuvA subunit/crossover junction endodeoxyribonuclease RuvC
MIVLGIDPGTASTGFGVISAEGSTLRALDHGLISTPARAHPSRRMGEIHTRVAALISQHAPEAVAMEDLFVGVNPRAVLSVGQARGAVLAACGQAGLDAAAYPPAEVKAAVCGYGRADKLQVQRMVGAMLSADLAAASDHATDALAAGAGGGAMIATLRGRVLERGSGRIVIDVGGVGYLLAATSAAIRLAVPDGEEVTLVTHLHVREDALILFGFASTAERDLFELLLGVSGVGPKAALAIVSGYAPDQIRRAIVTSDHALFTSITGVGRKTAERVVIDLKDKVGALPVTQVQDAADAPPADDHTAARDGLVGLGMSVAEAEAALRSIDADLPVGERIRQALAAGASA